MGKIKENLKSFGDQFSNDINLEHVNMPRGQGICIYVCILVSTCEGIVTETIAPN